MLIDHAAATGGGIAWCAVRMPAVGFYRRDGVEVVEEPGEGPGHRSPQPLVDRRLAVVHQYLTDHIPFDFSLTLPVIPCYTF